MTTRATVFRALQEGLGVEDIAVKHRIPRDRVREIVAHLRREGVLRIIYARAAEKQSGTK